eukprot:TRINITY_DN10228_c0_g1_i1.p1 TRINITY_DN10228_c0_g1~~TRINITY_DN10228_c0_g1_i1.p1  ORF type:complete len:489 (-),score=83.51 TRINITY_DN10228_c0_g1_i1:134-1600(-)
MILSPLAPAPIPTLHHSPIPQVAPAMTTTSIGTVVPHQLTPSLSHPTPTLSAPLPKAVPKTGLLRASLTSQPTAPTSTLPLAQSPKRVAAAKAKPAASPKRKPKAATTKRPVKRPPPTPSTAQPILPKPTKQRGKITAEEIQLVQNLIERCLMLYMNQAEVVTALKSHASIEPNFTNLVWQKLEEQNPDFFKAYHIRLRIKEQINAFNYLVSQQAQLLQKTGELNSRLAAACHTPGLPMSLPTSLLSTSFATPLGPNSFSTSTTPTITTNNTNTLHTLSASGSYQPCSPAPMSQHTLHTIPTQPVAPRSSLITSGSSILTSLNPRAPTLTTTLAPTTPTLSTVALAQTPIQTSAITSPIMISSLVPVPAATMQTATSTSNTCSSTTTPPLASLPILPTGTTIPTATAAIPSATTPTITTTTTISAPSPPTLTGGLTTGETATVPTSPSPLFNFSLPPDGVVTCMSDESSPRDDTPILEDIDTNQFFMT